MKTLDDLERDRRNAIQELAGLLQQRRPVLAMFESEGWAQLIEVLTTRRQALVGKMVGMDPAESGILGRQQGAIQELDWLIDLKQHSHSAAKEIADKLDELRGPA